MATVGRTAIGQTPEGATVEEIVIASARLEARFLTLGARLNALTFDEFSGLVPSFTIEEALGAEIVSGAVVAPVMNRLSSAKAPLDGEVLEFKPNHGPHLLHSGAGGASGRIWDVEELSPESVTFRIALAHLDGGFPGNREIRARFSVVDNILELHLSATTDKTTLMAPGFHPYWSLAGRGRGGQQLTVFAEQYLPSHSDTIPTGDIAGVQNSDFDFRSSREPGPDLDTCFVPERADGLRGVVRLEGGGLRLDIETDAPGVHVYTGHPLGIAVEPELWPDGPNKPGFPSFRLGPGDTFQQVTRHRFSRV